MRDTILEVFGLSNARFLTKETFCHRFNNGSMQCWVAEIYDNHVRISAAVVPPDAQELIQSDEYQQLKQVVHEALLRLLPFPYKGSLTLGDDIWRVTISPELARLHKFHPV